MVKITYTKVFDVLEDRGQKQRWLLTELRRRGCRISESYLSQIKSGSKQPSRRFIEAACEVLGMPESILFQAKGEKAIMAKKTTRKVVAQGPAPRDAKGGKGKINVAIIGVGNCASSLVQGRYFYQEAPEDQLIPGLMHVNLGGYHIRDINFVAAIDIDANKVGHDLSEAIFTYPNNTYKFSDVPYQGVKVARGMTHDGLGKYLSQIIKKSKGGTDDIVKLLKETKTDVVVNYLPVGSEEATKWYVEQVLAAGCGFINCIPVFIARDQYNYWPRRFKEAGLPIVGDDIKSQVGATIVHRVLTRLFVDRGVRLDRTYQLNFGGNTDFLNMLERERLESKKISKTSAVTSQLDYQLPPEDVHVGPSDYVPWLKDRKFCHIRMEGTTFGNVPLNVEVKLEVWDSPNSAGVVLSRGGRAAARSFVLLHEVSAGTVSRQHLPREARGFHRRLICLTAEAPSSQR
ncbi:MAG: myo-inositol-1-phosphate synthase [Acidobacteria bacterium]|nr:myo-inositol-1-phosphate synthase [Acidobacteriota bacterium]